MDSPERRWTEPGPRSTGNWRNPEPSAGDATVAYHRLHAASSAAAVALRRCRIGTLNTPELSGTRCFDTWADLLGSVVEMQNALRQDYSLRRGVGPAREAEEPRSPYLMERSVDTFERFLTSYLRPLTDAAADLLWPVVVAAGSDPGRLRRRMDEIWSGPATAAAVAVPDVLRDRRHGGPMSADLDEIDLLRAGGGHVHQLAGRRQGAAPRRDGAAGTSHDGGHRKHDSPGPTVS